MIDMEEWVSVSQEKDLKDGGAICVNPKGLPLILFKRSGQIFAISNRCPHLGCALAGGSIDGYTVTCPCHDWRFDIRSGEFLSAKEIKLPTYESRVESGIISVKIGR
jgi:3-phenylpropionate/trans-cinnamate dioxygenase ferredoxin subunit